MQIVLAGTRSALDDCLYLDPTTEDDHAEPLKAAVSTRSPKYRERVAPDPAVDPRRK